MILQGAFSVPAPQQHVWAAIWNCQTMASWVPGCTSAEQIDERTYKVRLEQQVSIFKASFDLLLTVVESDPPHRIVIHGSGKDRRLASAIQLQSEIKLAADDAQGTRMTYHHDISVFGRLGAVGYPIIRRKAQEAETEFARRATAALQEGL